MHDEIDLSSGLNAAQREAVETTEGHVLIIAGPGTGKTLTLVERTAHLIRQGVQPGEITLTTFTRRAADELRQRITRILEKDGFSGGASEVHIANFHSVATEILRKDPATSPYRPGFRVLDEVETYRLVSRSFVDFRRMPGVSSLVPALNKEWGDPVRALLRFFEQIREGFFVSDGGVLSQQAEALLSAYRRLLQKNNALDFSEILFTAYERMRTNPSVRAWAQERARYLMVDEYQDTNPIQEKLIQIWQEKSGNLCVVGDDDQSLYRFRGATVENLLGFTKRYSDVHVIHLHENYRSNGAILKVAEERLHQDMSALPDPARFRVEKNLVPAHPEQTDAKSVWTLYVDNQADWAARIATSIETVHAAGVPLEEIAILSHSVLDTAHRAALYQALRERGIDYDNPRGAYLMTHPAVRRFFGTLVEMLAPAMEKAINEGEISRSAVQEILQDAHLPRQGEEERKDAARDLEQTLVRRDVSFLELCTAALGVDPLRSLALAALSGEGVEKEKLAAVMEAIRKVEALLQDAAMGEDGTILSQEGAAAFAAVLVRRCIPFLRRINPKVAGEEDRRIPGHIPVMTIHQSKGLEFTVVILLEKEPPKRRQWYASEHLPLPRQPILGPSIGGFEEEIMDFGRLMYTARTRAKRLLIQTDIKEGCDDPALQPTDIASLSFPAVSKKPALKRIAYTTDIALFEACPRQYFFFREMGLPTKQTAALARGTLVHNTIDLLHHVMIEKETMPDETQAKESLQLVYGGMKSAGEPLSPTDGLQAWEQIRHFLNDPPEDPLKDSEITLYVSWENAILEGTLDRLGKDGTITDFKTGRWTSEKMQAYCNQLRFYRYLLMKNGGAVDAKNVLYFPEEETERRRSVCASNAAQQQAFMAGVKRTVAQIVNAAFAAPTEDLKRCTQCPLRALCGRGALFSQEEPWRQSMNK